MAVYNTQTRAKFVKMSLLCKYCCFWSELKGKLSKFVGRTL